MVPLPRFESFAALNVWLEAQCRRRMQDTLRGHPKTIGERLEQDLAFFQELPAVAYQACDRRTARVSSLSLVRYRGNDYSVPTAYGHQEVLVRGYVDEVVIACGAEVIARHRRSYEKEDFVFDPLHYLALLEQKTNALDQTAPFLIKTPNAQPRLKDVVRLPPQVLIDSTAVKAHRCASGGNASSFTEL